METKQIVVKGGGSNLFKVSYYNEVYYVYKVNVKIFSNDYHEIGKTKNFEDALSLIRSYSGKDIDSISSWWYKNNFLICIKKNLKLGISIQQPAFPALI